MMKASEIRIPVPWGYIAGKTWNKINHNGISLPVLCLHGTLDNAGTFCHLIPHLPQKNFYVAIDLPGHGKSSHLSQGMTYHFMDLTTSICRVIDFFGWKQVIILGHSFGGFLGAFFAAMYPELVSKLVMLDIIAPRSYEPDLTVNLLRFVANKHHVTNQLDLRAAPVYSREDILKRLKTGRATFITDEAAQALLSRSVVKKGQDIFSFSLDQRLKSVIHPILDTNHYFSIFSGVKCPILVVFAEESKPSLGRNHIKEVIKIYKANSAQFDMVFVPGNHDVHLNNPKIVSPHISKFIYPSSTRTWNYSDGQPLLGVHGLQDNAATFDRLVPLLPTQFFFVSIDLPGHGLSSHLPPGQLYHFMDMVTVINQVADHFGWKRFCFIGHSLGGQIGSYYISIYPERVIKFIGLDAVKPRSLPAKKFIPTFRDYNDKLFNVEKKITQGSVPSYTLEECLKRMTDSRWSVLTRESSEILLKRSVSHHNGGFTFRLDQRLKFLVFPPHTNEQQLALLSNVKCEVLVIKAEESLPTYAIDGYQKACFVYKKVCSRYEEVVVQGNHDVHLNHPERVADIITKFLLYPRSHL